MYSQLKELLMLCHKTTQPLLAQHNHCWASNDYNAVSTGQAMSTALVIAVDICN